MLLMITVRKLFKVRNLEMKKLDFNERKLCQIQGKIFEESIEKVQCSSLIFIRRFMQSTLATKFDDYSFMVMAQDINDCFYDIENEYGISSYGKIKYSKNEMFWIGYIYRALSIIYKLSSKKVFSLFNAKKIVKYYNIFHSFDIEQAAEKMMESIDYHMPDIENEAYMLLKKLIIREKLETLIGQNIDVYIDRPIGSVHPKHNDIIYPINYGYIKEIIAVDGDYQDVYVLGEDNRIDYCSGKVYAVIERENDIEDKLIVTTDDKDYSNEEIKEKINFQERFFKYKIVK